MKEQELITALKKGDEGAFNTLLETYRGRVVNTCYGFTRQRQDAEDVAQEVFVQVYRGMDKYSGKVALWVWLYRLAVNKSIDFLRAKYRQKRINHLKSLFNPDGSQAEIPDATDVEAQLENKELGQLLARVIDRLPERQKTAFVLSRQEGLTNQQIARVMDLSEGAVESLITRANRNLRKMLDQYYRRRL